MRQDWACHIIYEVLTEDMGTVRVKDGAVKLTILKINTIKMKAGTALNATKKWLV